MYQRFHRKVVDCLVRAPVLGKYVFGLGFAADVVFVGGYCADYYHECGCDCNYDFKPNPLSAEGETAASLAMLRPSQ